MQVRKRNRITFLAAAVIAANAAGNSLLRIGLSSQAGEVSRLISVTHLFSLTVVVGVLLLLSGFILQLSLLSRADLTFAIPVTSASYGAIALIGALGLHEPVSAAHWAGVLLILFGVAIVGRTKPLTTGRRP